MQIPVVQVCKTWAVKGIAFSEVIVKCYYHDYVQTPVAYFPSTKNPCTIQPTGIV